MGFVEFLGSADATVGILDRIRLFFKGQLEEAKKEAFLRDFVTQVLSYLERRDEINGTLTFLKRDRVISREFSQAATIQELHSVFIKLNIFQDEKLCVKQNAILTELQDFHIRVAEPAIKILNEKRDRDTEKMDLIIDLVSKPRPVEIVNPLKSDIIDPKVGAIPVLEDLMGIYHLIPWSEKLNSILQHSDFTAYSEMIKAAKEKVDKLDAEILEDVVILSIEGDFETAKSKLDSVRVDKLESTRRIAYHRLRGTLAYELGDSTESLLCYRTAMGQLESIPNEKNRNWFRQALEFDILRFNNDWDKTAELVEDARKIPTWYSHPAQDSSINEITLEINKEAFELNFKLEGSWRFGGGIGDGIMAMNRALALGYLVGDLTTTRKTRIKTALGGLNYYHATNRSDSDTLAMSIELLVAAKDDKYLEKLIKSEQTAFVKCLETPTDGLGLTLEKLALTRPKEGHGRAADEISIMILRIIRELGFYFSQSTQKSVSDEFFGLTMRYYKSNFDIQIPMIRGRNHYPIYFIDAFSEIATLTTSQISELVQVIRNQTPDVHGFWKLIAQHDWKDSESEIATEVTNVLIELSPKQSWDFRFSIGILWRIGRVFLELEPIIDHYILNFLNDNTNFADADTNSEKETLIWAYLTDRHHSTAAPLILSWIQKYISDYSKKLEKIEGNESISSGRFVDLRLVASAYQAYPIELQSLDLGKIAEQLLLALQNSNIESIYKASDMKALIELLEVMPDKQKDIVGIAIGKIDASHINSREIESIIFSSSKKVVPQLRWLQVKALLGKTLSIAEREILLKALNTETEPDILLAASDVCSILLSKQQNEIWILCLHNLTKNTSQRIRGEALSLLVKFIPSNKNPLNGLIMNTIRTELENGSQYVIQAILQSAFQNFQKLKKPLFDLIKKSLPTLATHKSKYVRRWVQTLQENFS